MENASKALIIAGAILLSILIIAIGIYIFNGANSTITDSMTSMSTQEIEAFNNQFLSYDGAQSGSNVKALIGRLVANSNTYKDERQKIPTFHLNGFSVPTSTGITNHVARPGNSEDTTNYVRDLGYVRSGIEEKHTYKVNFEFDKSGLIYYINIYYNL